MNLKSRLQQTVTALLTVILITLPGWGAGSSAEAAPACGSGDHGLLQELQKAHSGTGSTPLSIADVDFLSADTGRAAGNGFLIGTSDGGCHFQQIYTGQWSFRQIEFPDNVHGWALATVNGGQAVYLLRTADGGSTWTRLMNKPVTFERVEFLDGSIGFGYSRASTYYTRDGGESWSLVQTPANTRGAQFTSRNNGWAAVVVPGSGYRVMHTADGGKSWSRVLSVSAPEASYGQLYAGGNQVYALLYGGAGMSQTSYSLYGSSNAGADWTRIIAQETAGGGPAPGSGTAKVKKGPAAGTPGNLVLAGDAAVLVGYQPAAEEVGVGLTRDNGKTWKNQPAVPGFEGRISFTDPNHGWMTVKGLNSSTLYSTKDAGVTWTPKFTLETAAR
ncbi:WD40/YVTN/BNR-like repeat-containing protein [Paenibacillus piscarius]|uniref:WD40/YVTN/BNR-like repeat-containing protein n=1 Tax=Paenibacillus piscarius TaxID=1089681 RepID=UPI001EE80A0B|nr:YCF48-related protein [Paenibacillus piscarius]